jgi:tetratricopeptide (TPR) repeat protein
LFEEAVGVLRGLYGVNHPVVLNALNNQAFSLDGTGDFKGAERVGREFLAGARAVYGPSHVMVANALWRVGEALASQRTAATVAEGESMLREALEMHRRLSGDDHPDVQLMRVAMARALMDQQRLAGAESLYIDALNARRAKLGAGSPAVASSLDDLGELADARRNYAESERFFREALVIWRATGSRTDEARATVAIGRALQLQGKVDDAEPMLRGGMEGLRAALGSESKEVGNVTEVLGNIAMRRGNVVEAERLHTEGLAIRRNGVWRPQSGGACAAAEPRVHS